MPKRLALAALIVATLPLSASCCDRSSARGLCVAPPSEPALEARCLEGLIDELVAELAAGLRGLLRRP